jgi:hypothetical protein
MVCATPNRVCRNLRLRRLVGFCGRASHTCIDDMSALYLDHRMTASAKRSYLLDKIQMLHDSLLVRSAALVALGVEEWSGGSLHIKLQQP